VGIGAAGGGAAESADEGAVEGADEAAAVVGDPVTPVDTGVTAVCGEAAALGGSVRER